MDQPWGPRLAGQAATFLRPLHAVAAPWEDDGRSCLSVVWHVVSAAPMHVHMCVHTCTHALVCAVGAGTHWLLCPGVHSLASEGEIEGGALTQLGGLGCPGACGPSSLRSHPGGIGQAAPGK